MQSSASHGYLHLLQSPSKVINLTSVELQISYPNFLHAYYNFWSHHIASYYVTLNQSTLHYSAVHYIILHYITIHFSTPYNITLHDTTLYDKKRRLYYNVVAATLKCNTMWLCIPIDLIWLILFQIRCILPLTDSRINSIQFNSIQFNSIQFNSI